MVIAIPSVVEGVAIYDRLLRHFLPRNDKRIASQSLSRA